MEQILTEQLKVSLTKKLLKDELFLKFFSDRERFLDFLGEVFPLKEMSSSDSRHEDALGDFHRHLVFNDDWSVEYVLEDRLKFAVQNDDTFVKFFDHLVSPDYQTNINAIHGLITVFATDFLVVGLKFILTGYKNDLPIYKLSLLTDTLRNIPRDVKRNDIPFLSSSYRGRPDFIGSHVKPGKFPSFVLTKDNWNDYGAETLHHLFLYPKEGEVTYVGGVKIMKKDEKKTVVPDEFYLLDENYCSLGTGEDYYQNLKKIVPTSFTSILFALRDTAFFPMIYEAFEDEEVFKDSLVRDDRAERNSRTVAYTFAGGNLEERYKFIFKFKPLFANEETEISFPFSSSGSLPRRIIALIGKNGTGKTQLLSSLAKNLSNRESALFKPQTPVFGKVLAVSYSVFDTFEIPQSDNAFNYKYCGLKGSDGKLLTEEELERRFYESAEKIKNKKRITKLYKVLENFVDRETRDLLIKEDSTNEKEYLNIDLADFSSIKQKLSSGQSLLLFVVVELLAELRFDSLVLFDEPETHLHPNAITQLVSAVYDLVTQFDSYCVIATHSPIIIQGLTSDSVYVTEKVENVFSIRKIYTESFGENLANITDEIFGNRDISQEYKKIVDSLIKDGKNYAEIVELLESDGVPLSLNVKIYIRSMAKP